MAKLQFQEDVFGTCNYAKKLKQPSIVSLSVFESHSFTIQTRLKSVLKEGNKTAEPPSPNCSNTTKRRIVDLIRPKQANKGSVLLRGAEQSNHPNSASCKVPHHDSSGDAAASVRASLCQNQQLCFVIHRLILYSDTPEACWVMSPGCSTCAKKIPQT